MNGDASVRDDVACGYRLNDGLKTDAFEGEAVPLVAVVTQAGAALRTSNTPDDALRIRAAGNLPVGERGGDVQRGNAVGHGAQVPTAGVVRRI